MAYIIEIIRKIILNAIVSSGFWRLTLITRAATAFYGRFKFQFQHAQRQKPWAALEFRLNKGGYVKRI